MNEPVSKFAKRLIKKYEITPEIAEAIEQDAANLYAHPTGEGWCCACDYDLAVMQGEVQAGARKVLLEVLEKKEEYTAFGQSIRNEYAVPVEVIEAKLEELG